MSAREKSSDERARDDDVLAIFERALQKFGEHGGGAAELAFHGTRDGTTRFAGSRVTQTGEVRDRVIQARVVVGRRVGAARINALDEAALAAVLARAQEIAARMPESEAEGEIDGFADGRAPLEPHADSFDAATAAVDAAGRAALIAPAFAAAARAGMTAAGSCSAGETHVAVATSAGCRRQHRYTRARFDFIASDGKASARRSSDGCRFGAIAGEHQVLVEDTIHRAERARDPIVLLPGEYDVILEPPALAELLEWMCLIAFGARTLLDGSSPLAERLGQRLTGPLTIYDDALSGECDTPTLPFDAEGTPRRRLTLLDEGVARAVVHDRQSARLAGTTSTGHAAPIGDELSEGGPMPMHAMIAPGPDDEADLVARIERGLYVARFHYVNGLLDTRRALMTGMTRDGVWLVEDGKIGRAVANLRWTESLLEAGARIGGITRRRRLTAAGLNEGWYLCPTISFRGWKFSG